jgi:phospholipase C
MPAMDRRLTRRQLIGAGVAAAGVAAAGVAGVALKPWDSAPHGAAVAPRKAGRLQDIEHVVIVFQENRSFDHYFGTFPGVIGFGDAERRQVFAQPGFERGGHEGVLLPWHLGTKGGPECIADITHEWGPQHGSWNGGRMDGFVRQHLQVDGPSAGPETMGYFDRRDLGYYFALAEAYTICDRYHCSVIGPSDPNHLYLFSGTLDPDGRNGGPMIDTPTKAGLPLGEFTWTTMPEQLSARGVDWKVYASRDREGLENILSCFRAYRRDAELRRRGLGTIWPNDFFDDVRRGELPQVSWVLGALHESEHPGYSSPLSGELTSARVIRELMAHPDVWSKTAVLITWDENGGFFDHVAPPTPEPGTKGEYLTIDRLPPWAEQVRGPIGLGFRVPFLVVSPFSRGGFVSSDVFDHTSILRFLEARFGAEVPNLSEWRRSVTGDLTSAFNFAAPDASVPDLPKATVHAGTEVCHPVDPSPRANRMPTQEPGTPKRPSGPV